MIIWYHTKIKKATKEYKKALKRIKKNELGAEEVEKLNKKAEEEFRQRILNGESVYLDFCIWCNAYHKGEGKNNPELFGTYLKENNTELNFWQKKHIAEKYFGWIYEWNVFENKWNIKKKVS